MVKTKKAAQKGKGRHPGSKRSPQAAPESSTVASSTITDLSTMKTAPTAKTATGTRPVGRLHRSTLTPAGLRGRDLVRFLRIHAKKPYGNRGEEAIRQLAV